MTPEEMAATHARAFAGQGRAWAAQEIAALLTNPFTLAIGDTRAFALTRIIAGEAELLARDYSMHRRLTHVIHSVYNSRYAVIRSDAGL